MVGGVLGYLAQDAAHDFSGASLGEAGGELDDVGHGDGADLFAHVLLERGAELFGIGDAIDEGDEGIQRLALDVVGHGGDSGFGYGFVADEGALHFGGADAVAGDVDHVVDAAHEPEVTVAVHAAGIAGKVHVVVHGEVDVDEAVVVAPGGAHHAGPRAADAELATLVGVALGAVVAQDDGLDAEEPAARATGLEGVAAGVGVDHVAAGFGLPPRVYNRAAPATDVGVVPHPGLGVDGFAHGAEQAERGEVVFGGPFGAVLNQRADSSGGGVENGDLVLLHHAPIACGIGVGGHAFKHERGGAVGQRAVDDVAVAGDPADVRATPVDVVVLNVEGVAVGEHDVEQVACGGMHHAFGLAGGAGGVEDVERVFSVHHFGRAIGGSVGHQLVEPQVARGIEGAGRVVALHHHDVGDGGAIGHGLVGNLLEGDGLACAKGNVGGDEQLAVGIVDAVLDGVCAEAAEDHRVNRADAGAAEHDDGQLEDHRHVDADTVSLAHAQALEHVGKLADLAVQFAVGQAGGLVLRLALPEQRGLVFGGRAEEAVEAVHRHVQLAILEPCVLNDPLLRFPRELHRHGGLAEPGQLVGLLEPEGFRIVDGAIPQGLVLLFGLDAGALLEGGRRGEFPRLVKQGIETA